MSTVIGDRDVLLLGSSQRALNPPNSGILLTTSAAAFKVDTSGNPLPSSITVKASLIGIVGFVNFTATGATVTDHGDNTATVAFSSLSGQSCNITASITVNGQAFTSSVTLAKVTDGASGTSGTSGNQYATAYLYQWATSTPALPNGTTGYTWATGVNNTYSGTDNWSLNPSNPGTSGFKLYVAAAQITAPGGTVSTVVSYSNATIQVWSANGANGTNGVSGVQSTTVQVYRWDSSTAPAAPAGSPTYIWSGANAGTFGAAPTGWVLSPGTAPSQGMTLWAARVRVTDSATNSSTVFNWSDSAIIAVGSSGSNGAAGASGASYVTAYCASSTGTTSTAPAQTTGKTSLPATNDGGITGTWSATVPALSTGQYLYQSDGIYDPQTNKVTWSIPYWSSLKVGNLSAISANLGAITAGSFNINSGVASIDANGNAILKSVLIEDGSGNVLLSSGNTGSIPTSINNAATTATWSGVSGTGKPADYATVSGADAATSLGFNPQFSNWTDTYPYGWSAWTSNTPTKEAGTVRTSPYAVKWTVSGETGMTAITGFSTPLPAGVFVQGAFDINIITNNGGGSPGYLIRLFTNQALTVYTDTVVGIADRSIGGWQRVPFTARVPAGQQIWGLQIYQMAAYAGMPGGSWANGSVCVFDNLAFDFLDSSTDNTQQKWIDVGGAGKPSDNATTDLVLIGNGVTITGNSAQKTQNTSGWDSDVYSKDSYTGGAFASAVAVDTTGHVMFGLNDDPAYNSSYDSINYALYFNAGDLRVYEGGTDRGSFGSYAVGDVGAVIYDGSSVKYLKNGAVIYTSTVGGAANQVLYFDSSFNEYGSSIKNLRFGPMSSNNWVSIGGTNKPENNATVGATIGVNLGGQITSGNASTYIASAAIQSAMVADLRTSNYAEDGSGNPTAGAKLASGGTALKVSSANLQIGPYVFTDAYFRVLQAIDGSYAGQRVIWRGNNDVSTRGGAPDINCLSMTSEIAVASSSVTGNQLYAFGYTLSPSAYSNYTDNLDAMSSIHLQLFHNATDSTPNSEIYASCGSRTYDGNTGAMRGSVICWDRGGFSSLYGYAGYVRVRIANSYGWSATRDFGPATSAGGTLPSATITGVGGSSSSGSGGTSGGGGGACPAPWVKVKLVNGKEVSARDLHEGARVMAVDDNTLKPLPNGGILRDVRTIWAQRYQLKLSDGRTTEWSGNHRFAVLERGWVHVQHLRPGDQIIGLTDCIVESVLAVGEGEVVSYRVEGAGTYFAGDMLCHNLKTPG